MARFQKAALATLVVGCAAESSRHRNKESPIKRVLNLLEKMRSELQAEADHDAELYDKMVCWCETSEKEKTTAVSQAEATIKDLEAEIEERSARSGELGTEAAGMKKQIAKDTAALEEAIALREKEAAAFRGEEKDTVQAMTNLKNALSVLSLQQVDSVGFKNLDAGVLAGLRVVLSDTLLKHETLLLKKTGRGSSFLAVSSVSKGDEESAQQILQDFLHQGVSEDEQQLPLAFAEHLLARSAAAAAKRTGAAAPSSFLQVSSESKQPAGAGESYTRQSDGIVGILSAMMDNFKAELKASQDAEATAVADHKAMVAAKEEQISVGKEKLDEYESGSAGNTKALSDAKENLEMTRQQRTDDTEFLRNLKLQCNDLDAQWEARSKTRGEEIKAVSETIAILTEDDNFETMKTSGLRFVQESPASFLQTGTGAMMKLRRAKAAKVLRDAANADDLFETDDLLSEWRGRKTVKRRSVGSGARRQLSTLAISVELDGFTKVKEMIDKLVSELKVQQEEERKFKAHCVDQLDANEKDTFQKNEVKKGLENKLKELGAVNEKLAKEIAEAQTHIAETEIEIKKASQTREDENTAFQQTVGDQRATQTILKKALSRLEAFYKKSFLQTRAEDSEEDAQTPPVQFNKMKSNAGASPVMGLLEQIIEDSKKLETEAITGEEQAQEDYEKMVLASNKLIKELEAAVSEKGKAQAQVEIDMSAAKSSLELTGDELESLADVENDLHNECDFVLKNFDIRQKARLQEIDAISEAKSILSGMK